MTLVEATGIGPVTVGARLYRWRGERLLAVIVKAAYELRHRAPMHPMPPPVWRTKASAAHPGDEPFPLRQAEIVIGPLPQVARTSGASVGLAVRRAEEPILDVRRTAGDDGARDATVGFGPLPPASPGRAALGAGLDPSSLVGTAELTLADDLDPAFFQAAPAAQRLDDLRPGDDLVLMGMSPVARVLHAALPAQRGAAVVQIGAEPPRRFALRLDRIHVAPDAMVAELSYRFALPVPESAQSIRVAGGLDSASAPFAAAALGSMTMKPVSVLADAPPVAPREERPPPTEILGAAAVAGGRHGGTVLMSPAAAAEVRPMVPSSPFESTAVVSPDAPAPSSLPFHRRAGAVAAATPPPSEPIPGAPWAGAPAAAPPRADDAPPMAMTMVLGAGMPSPEGAPSPQDPQGDAAPPPAEAAPEVDLDLDLELPPSVRTPPASVRGADLGPIPGPTPATLEDQGPLGLAGAPPPQGRPKADPWRKDDQGEGAAAPAAPPPAAPRAGPTRPDLSAGLYKRFKR